MVATWVVERGRIDEIPVPLKPLGRHIEHDSRSLMYPWVRTGGPLKSMLWQRMIDILNQLEVGACTGNAETGALGTQPLFPTLAAAGIRIILNEVEALALYSAAETIDGDGPYPPQDNGSSGLSVCKAAKNAGLISGYTHCLSLADALDALQVRPLITGVNWYDCIAPDSRVLTSDLRWTPIQKLSPGDEIIGFDEHSPGGRGRKYRRASVVANDLVVKPTMTVHYDLGGRQHSLTVSEGHLFLVRNSNEMQVWKRADQLRLDDEVYSLVGPYEPDQSREAGWLAGFFDGEGSVGVGTHHDRGVDRRSYRLDVSQKTGPTLDELKHVLASRDFDFQVQNSRDDHPVWKPLENLWLRGGRPEILRFLGTIRPERLVSHGAGFWEDQAISSKSPSRAVITGIRRSGLQEVHAIGTSTGTLLVEGLLSHNSFDSPSSSGLVAISPGAQVRGGHEFLVRGIDVVAQTVLADNSWGTDWGLHGSFSFSFATWERLLAEQGDATVSVPLTAPAPVPVPVPPAPVPPAPVPPVPPVPSSEIPDTDPADITLAGALNPWAYASHIGENRRAAEAAATWLEARGFSVRP